MYENIITNDRLSISYLPYTSRLFYIKDLYDASRLFDVFNNRFKRIHDSITHIGVMKEESAITLHSETLLDTSGDYVLFKLLLVS